MPSPIATRSVRRSRRDFLAASLTAAAVGLAGGARRGAAQDAAEAPALVHLDDGLAQITGAGGNVVVLAGAAGLVLVDTGGPGHTAAVRALLAAHFPGKPVETIVNTHWHLRHTGGNDELGAAASRIVAHENTRLWMSTKFYVEWQDRRYAPRAPAAIPNATFFSSDPQPRTLDVGGERVVYAHLKQAHTDGDIYVHLPERNVVVAGGMVTAGRYPVVDYVTGGWIGGLADATQALIDLGDADTRVIPAAGGPLGRAELETQHRMLTTVRERMEAIALEGRGIDDMLEARITEEFDALYGDPERFVTNAYHGLWWGNRLRGIVA